jgi:hypothetical protein
LIEARSASKGPKNIPLLALRAQIQNVIQNVFVSLESLWFKNDL